MDKKIGVLTSGGDCAGLNAALRAITLRATEAYGWIVYGIHQGTNGFLNKQHTRLYSKNFPVRMLRQGGTILGSTKKGNPFSYPMPDGSYQDRSQELIAAYYALGLSALIGIGGDGSLKILRRLAQQGNFNLIGIPKTIDNDVSMTENAIGFLTASEFATKALDCLHPTAESHDRVLVTEVMGRDSGHIALYSGIAGGSDIILIPEISYRIQNICHTIQTIKAKGRNCALITVAEAVLTEDGKHLTVQDIKGAPRYGGIGHYIATQIEEKLGVETRHIILGHLQRGGDPIAADRVISSAFGVKAVDLIAEGKKDRMVAWQNRQVTDVPLRRAIDLSHKVDVNGTLVHTARGLGISFGE